MSWECAARRCCRGCSPSQPTGYELEQGCRLTFPPAAGTLDAIARTIDAERHCCPFLRFALTVGQADAPFTLDITGPPGTKEFLTDLLGESA